jgi:hypothetical protein
MKKLILTIAVLTVSNLFGAAEAWQTADFADVKLSLKKLVDNHKNIADGASRAPGGNAIMETTWPLIEKAAQEADQGNKESALKSLTEISHPDIVKKLYIRMLHPPTFSFETAEPEPKEVNLDIWTMVQNVQCGRDPFTSYQEIRKMMGGH